MSSRNLFEIVLKVIGILCFLWFVGAVGSSLTYLVAIPRAVPREHFREPLLSEWFIFFPAILYFVLGSLLLLKAETLAAKLVPEEKAIPLTVGENRSAFSLALRVLGTYLLVETVLAVGRLIPEVIASRMERQFFHPRVWVELVETAIKLPLSIYLLLGAKRFVAFVLKGSLHEKGPSEGGLSAWAGPSVLAKKRPGRVVLTARRK